MVHQPALSVQRTIVGYIFSFNEIVPFEVKLLSDKSNLQWYFVHLENNISSQCLAGYPSNEQMNYENLLTWVYWREISFTFY